MNPQQLEFINAVCDRAFNSVNPSERKEAENFVSTLSSIEGIDQCVLILQYSQSPFSQHAAISSLQKAISNYWTTVSSEKQKHIRTQVLNFMSNKSQDLSNYVQNALFSLVARVVKLSWLASEENQSIIPQLIQYTNRNIESCLFALRLLNVIVSDISGSSSRVIPAAALTERKTLLSFRNIALTNIFILGFEMLQRVSQSVNQQQLNEQMLQLLDCSLRLVLSCLSYDFIGTITSDDGDYIGPIQVPVSWKENIENGKIVILLFEIYSKISAPVTYRALQCLSLLSAVRHSLFNSDKERKEYLSIFLINTSAIMRNQIGFNEAHKFHEFCRLICQLKTHFQVPMFVSTDGYEEWISLVAALTIQTFSSTEWSSNKNNSIYFLINLWSRLVSAMPYLKADYTTFIDAYVPKITESYITSRIQSVEYSLMNSEDTYEELMSNEEEILHQLENIASLSRFHYEEVGNYLTTRTEQIIAKYSDLTQQYQATGSEQLIPALQLCEGELVWILSIISMTIAFQGAGSSSQVHETMDGQLAGTVFKFILSDNFPDQRVSRDKEIVDLALLTFLSHFRKKYLGETQLSATSNVFKKLKEVSNLNDHLMIYSIVLNRVIGNCKIWVKNEEVVKRSLQLFFEFCSSYSCSKSLTQLDLTKYVLQNHSSYELFPFLLERAFGRQRTTFYQSLMKLILVDDKVMKFDVFVAPFSQNFQQLMSIPPNMWQNNAKQMLIGIFRDIRGILQAALTSRAYMMVFDWLHPQYIPLFLTTCETFYSNSEIVNILLKCLEELSHNRQQRISFEASSPNGILLFRIISKILFTYSNGILSTPIQNNIYKERYKGMSVCFRIFAYCLQGGYVNFGIFDLYGDPALMNAQRAIINLCLGVSLDDCLNYPKLSLAFFQMLEAFSKTYPNILIGIEANIFIQIFQRVERGLNSVSEQVSSLSASIIDNLASFCYKQISTESLQSQYISNIINEHPELFPTLMALILNLIVYEDMTNHWSLSRPLFVLVLLNEKYFEQLQQQFISRHSPSTQAKYRTVWEGIMSGVERNLESSNRDKFSQNISTFLTSIKQIS